MGCIIAILVVKVLPPHQTNAYGLENSLKNEEYSVPKDYLEVLPVKYNEIQSA